MMLKQGEMDRDVIEAVRIDSLLPQYHQLRKSVKRWILHVFAKWWSRCIVMTMAGQAKTPQCCSKWC